MKRLSIWLSIIMFISSCASESRITEDNIDDVLSVAVIEMDSALKAQDVDEKLDYLIKELSLSDEMIKIMSGEPNLFDNQLLNDVSKVQNYNTSKSKATNMGIYGAELNYIIHFGQTQNSLKYMIASKQIADQLGVAMAFDQKVMEQYQNSPDNKDTLINIVFGAYDNVKKYMRNSDQFEMASLVIAGSWIENIYLVTKQLPTMTNKNNQMQIYGILSSQQEYLKSIIELLNILNKNAENDNYTTNIINGLSVMDSCYSTIPDATYLNAEKIAEIHEKIGTIRNSITE